MLGDSLLDDVALLENDGGVVLDVVGFGVRDGFGVRVGFGGCVGRVVDDAEGLPDLLLEGELEADELDVELVVELGLELAVDDGVEDDFAVADGEPTVVALGQRGGMLRPTG